MTPKILIVDDNKDFLKMVVRRLDSICQCQNAENGKEALEKMEHNTFSLILTDYRMPEMDGLQFFEKVKSSFPDIPVIMFTGEGDIKIAAEALRKGVRRYIEKPLNFEMLHMYVKYEIEVSELKKENNALKKSLMDAQKIKVGNA